MNGKPWSDTDLAILRQLYADTPTADIARQLSRTITMIYVKAHKIGLRKSAAFMASPAACRLRRGDNIGAEHRFPKGHVPHNKGKRCFTTGRMAVTQFKKGQMPRNWKPIGSERLCDGYVQRKMTETGYPPRDWVPVHVLLWTQAYGKPPNDYVVIFINGNKRDVRLDNLTIITRRDLMRLNTIHNRYSGELRHAIQLRGALQRKITMRTRREESNHRPA